MSTVVAPDHLHPLAWECLKLSDDERIKKIKSPRWIGYPRAKEIHADLYDCFDYPQNSRMPCRLVWGDSNAGKSCLVEHFVEEQNRRRTDALNLPILLVQAPPEPDTRDFFSLCLQKLGAPHRRSDRADMLRSQLITILRNLRTKMLVIDEVHHLIAGSGLKQRAFLQMLKFLNNELAFSIVVVGTAEAKFAFKIDPQIYTRFEQIEVPVWKDGHEYRHLLGSYEYITPLRAPSDLAGDHLAGKLLHLSGGLIGELSTLLRRAAEKAIRTGRECIDGDLLDHLGWVIPSARRLQ